jgi:hypothetical protein
VECLQYPALEPQFGARSRLGPGGSSPIGPTSGADWKAGAAAAEHTESSVAPSCADHPKR